jgi:hypothetical protein
MRRVKQQPNKVDTPEIGLELTDRRKDNASGVKVALTGLKLTLCFPRNPWFKVGCLALKELYQPPQSEV